MKDQNINKPGMLLVANWDSNVGYAWWLIESFWQSIAQRYSSHYHIYLAYPSISKLPSTIEQTPIQCVECDFSQLTLSLLPQQLRFIYQHQIQLIYFSDHGLISLYYALFRLAGVRHIINHDHTPGARPAARGVKKLIKSSLARLSPMAVDSALATSDYVKQRLIHTNCFPAHKCHAIPNGISEIEANSTASRSVLGLPQNGAILVTAARANRYKGIDAALRMVTRIYQQHPTLNFYYLVLGDGPHLEEFKTLAKTLGISQRVIFGGKVTRVSDYLAHCDIAIHPSKGEVGYSLAILEYMRAGLPVLVPNNPSVNGATLHKQNGYIYLNEDDASEAIYTYLTQHEMRRAHGAHAKQHQSAHFQLQQTHQRLMQHFQGLLKI